MPREFPHLLTEDIILWKRFLASPHNVYTTFEYDVRVGNGRDPGPDYPNNIRQMALDLSQRRIDAIGHTTDDITIIEISLNPGLTQLGQLIAYPTLYRQTFQYTGIIKTLLVAAVLQSDLLPVLEEGQLSYVLLP
jgi:hypothetical protein